MLAEVLELERLVQEVTGRLRENDLAAVPGGHHPSRTVHIHPDVARVRQQRLTRMDSHSDAQPRLSERLLRRGGGRNCVRGPSERDEEGISLRVDLDPAVLVDRLADDAMVPGQDVRVLVAELMEQLRRALDVGEEEGDGSGRQLSHSRPSEAPRGRQF